MFQLIGWLIDWLIDWLIGWLIDWLIDWFVLQATKIEDITHTRLQYFFYLKLRSEMVFQTPPKSFQIEELL